MKNLIRLVALSSGIGKNGKPWFRAVFKSTDDNGHPVVADFWLAPEVGEEAKKQGLLEDVDVVVECGLDSYLRMAITGIHPAEEEDFL